MADNVDITAGVGTTIATDNIGGVNYQRNKVVWGPDGTANDADVASGKPLPTQLYSATGTSISLGTGAASTATMRVTIDTNQLGSLGQTVKASAASVVPASDWVYNTGYYVTVAASATAFAIEATTGGGAAGNYLDHVTIFPAATTCGAVSIFDNTATVASWPGGSGTNLLTLTPFTIYLGAVSRATGGWKVTTGGNVSLFAVGRFT